MATVAVNRRVLKRVFIGKQVFKMFFFKLDLAGGGGIKLINTGEYEDTAIPE
jgi:hypothetical protein